MNTIKKILFVSWITAILILAHFYHFIHDMSAGLAVLSGVALSLIFHNPFPEVTKKIAATLMTWSVVGLGFGMNLIVVAKVGAHGIGYTLLSISLCALLGLSLGYVLKNKRDTSVLITFGTAICGASTIAAIAPTIRAKHHEITVALAIIFMLNAVALFVFPPIGHLLHLSQEQFGLWSALAIHDTSSVVGATLQYGDEALNVGTTVKLARALWIVPLTIIIGFYYSRMIFHKEESHMQGKAKKPWFILGFLLAAASVTWIPFLKQPGLIIREVAEQALVVTLFCIGANLSRDTIKTVGIKPFVQGILLWVMMGMLTLLAIYYIGL